MDDPERAASSEEHTGETFAPLSDLVDLEELRRLLDLSHRITGVPSGIVDRSGNPILSVGSREICRGFHWTHPETRKACRAMEADLRGNAPSGGCAPYRCGNGLWHIAMPLVIHGVHHAILFLGPFCHEDEPVDMALFRRRAKELGFEEEKYLLALRRVPVYSRRKVDDIIGFFRALVAHLSELGRANLKLIRQVEKQERLEAKLRQSMKMEAIGTLAGGIAHDFNNILGAIMGYADMAFLDAPEEGRMRKWLEGILGAAERAKDLVSQILAFSRGKERGRMPILITPVLKESVKLLRSTLPATIEVVQRIEHHPDLVLADPTQIHQLVINLCANAHHAMEETGGQLVVSLTRETDGPPDDPGATGTRVFLKLTVEDTGHGMDPATLARIFDPTFTTKEPGVGTGMGMSLVHGIVREHQGEIDVSSTPGMGTTVSIRLPVVEMAHRAAVPDISTLPTGRERILLVDDEAVLADLGTQMLRRLGYEVTQATTPGRALFLFTEDPDGFDLVISDMTMPEMTGDRLATALLEIRPTLPVILCTGHSDRIDPEKVRRIGIRELAMKPLSIGHLARSIRRVLAPEEPPAPPSG